MRRYLRPLSIRYIAISNHRRNLWRLNHVVDNFATRRASDSVYAQPPALTTAINQYSTMSSSEEENFNLDVSGSESDDYAPAPKKKAAPKAKAAAPKKAPAKPKASKKVLADKDDNASGSDDDEPALEAGPSGSGLQDPRKKKTATETYTKVY